jgi:tRNA modification GTPase
MNRSDTIFAVSSGSGVAGISVIRMSGPASQKILELVAGTLPKPRLASVRRLRDPASQEVIDQAMVLWMPGPNSSTGEDVAEFHVHGSVAVIDALLGIFQGTESVRLAEAGEFSRRAFMHDRMDLVEAEGLSDLLHARTEAQRRMAMHHMLGGASSIYETWRGELIAIQARLEAAIDFADEEGVAESALADVKARTLDLIARLEKAVAEATRAGAVRSGIKVVFAGPPNVGKSSLLNLVAAREAAIVSSHPGTTRDVIEVSIVLAGVPVILTDTAGLRSGSDDEIENIGMARARSELAGADIVVWINSPDVDDPERCAAPAAVRVLNKSDLLTDKSIRLRNDEEKAVEISARTGAGVDAFIATLEGLVVDRAGGMEHATIIRARQKSVVEDAVRHLHESLTFGAEQIELAAECVRKANHSMGRVTGRVDVEDLLGSIFSEFCIGK